MKLRFTKRKFLRCGMAAMLISTGLGAQDFHLTQYDAAPLNLNPAMTGMFDGFFRIHAHYRTQWSAIATNPFQTMEVAYDMPLRRFSIGGQVMDYTAGAGNYNVFSFEGSAAYDLAIDKNDHHHLSFGLQAGLIQKSINFSKLTWGNQYTYAGDGGFDQSVNSGENFSNQSFLMPDVNLGMMYFFAKEIARVNPFFGFSAHHINTPKETFYGNDENKLPVKYIIHTGAKINFNETVQLLPKIFWMRQTLGQERIRSNDKELTFNLFLHYYLKQSDAYILFGPTLRLSGPLSKNTNLEKVERDAAAIEMGLKYGKYTYRLSYDINTSTLNPYTNGRGGLEISVTYVGRRHQPNPVINCPRL